MSAETTEHTRPVWVTVLDSEGEYIYLGDPDGPAPPLRSRWFPEPDDASDAKQSKHKRSRFAGMWPDEYEALPDLDFWDKGLIPGAPNFGVLPRFPDGAVIVVYAKADHHKTNLLLTMLIEAVLDRGARVLYAAGEGGYGIGKQRLPAHCGKRGITTKALRGKFRLVRAVPVFKSANDTEDFIAEHRDFRPDIAVIDTLATATPGENLNEGTAASHLTDNGAAGRIKRALNALVIVVAHEGKGDDRGPLGHTGLSGNPDAVLRVERHFASGAVKLSVKKMKDGPDGFDIYFRTPPQGANEVPVPARITRAEYEGLIGTKAGGRPKGGSKNQGRWHDALLQLGADSYATGILEPEFARWLVAHCRAPDYGDKDPVEKELTDLRNAHQIDSLRGTLFGGGREKGPYKWFARREDRPLSL